MSGTRIGMVRCEHCGRQFNPHSAARHIPWCEKQKQERNKHRLSNEKRQALERYKWRISYRPSNYVAGRHRTPPSDFTLKKSSINSSATLSSPSASSSASIGTSIGSTNEGYQRRQAKSVQPKKPPTTTTTTSGQLQRSISSLTLTKRQDLARPSRAPAKSSWNSEETSNGFDARTKQRTKSTNDLSSMGELVETLARRVDEIYAQNQLLLANLPKSSAAGAQGRPQLGSDEDEDGDSDSDNGGELVKCHHCKTGCLQEANYCHKCGCKLVPLTPSPASPD